MSYDTRYIDVSEEWFRPQHRNHESIYVPMKLSHGPRMHQNFSRIRGDSIIVTESPRKYVHQRPAFDW